MLQYKRNMLDQTEGLQVTVPKESDRRVIHGFHMEKNMEYRRYDNDWQVQSKEE